MKMKRIPKSSKLQCAFCQGKGIQPGAERLSCIVCGGNGRVTARQPYTICKECGGRGRKPGTTLYCLSCHGKGFVEEKRYPLAAKSPVSKTRRKSIKIKRRKGKFSQRKRTRKSIRKKGGKKSAKPKARKTKAAVKKGRKSFLEGLLGTFKIL